MGASVFVCKRGGTIVTCAATTGYMIEYDNRHLWMKLKTIKGRHFSNYREAWAREPARVRGQDRAAALGGLPPRRGGRGGLPGAPQPPRGEDRRAVPRARPRGSASTTPHFAPRSARTASRSSGGTTLSRRDRRPADRDRPRGDRRRTTSTRPSRGTRDVFGADGRAPRGRRVRRGRRGAARRSPTPTSSCSPHDGDSPVAKYLERRRARASTTSATAWRTARRPSRR